MRTQLGSVLAAVALLALAACGGGSVTGHDDDHDHDAGGDGDGGGGDGDDADGGAGDPDAGLVGPELCGDRFCRTDQTCEDGQCVFDCVGTDVPGDYPTLQEAVDALGQIDADATVCLTSPSSSESLEHGLLSPGYQRSLAIIGRSMDQTQISWIYGHYGIEHPWRALTIKGVALRSVDDDKDRSLGMLLHDGAELAVIGSRVDGINVIALDGHSTATMDGRLTK